MLENRHSLRLAKSREQHQTNSKQQQQQRQECNVTNRTNNSRRGLNSRQATSTSSSISATPRASLSTYSSSSSSSASTTSNYSYANSSVAAAVAAKYGGGGGGGGGGKLDARPFWRRGLAWMVSSLAPVLSLFMVLMKKLHLSLRACVLFASKVWSFVCYVFRKQTRALIQHKAIRYHVCPLSPLSSHRLSLVKRKVLVLDLDETLIHSFHDGVMRQTVKPGTPPDFILKVTIDRHPVRFFVHKRPHVDFFLQMVSKWYELVVFTASMEIYGTAVADRLDNNTGILRRRYYRQHCTYDFGSYTKDLSAINDDLSSVFILDNSPGAYRAYPDNAIPIKSWFNDPSDTALLNLLPVLDALRFVSDVRSVLSRNREAHRNITWQNR